LKDGRLIFRAKNIENRTLLPAITHLARIVISLVQLLAASFLPPPETVPPPFPFPFDFFPPKLPLRPCCCCCCFFSSSTSGGTPSSSCCSAVASSSTTSPYLSRRRATSVTVRCRARRMSSASGRRSDSRSEDSSRPSATPHSRPQTTSRISSMRTLHTSRCASGANAAARANSEYALTHPSNICPSTPTTASAVPSTSMGGREGARCSRGGGLCARVRGVGAERVVGGLVACCLLDEVAEFSEGYIPQYQC
jgi:hypothetical protein